MGSTFSVPKLLKKPLSCFTGRASEWAETPEAYILRVAVPRLKKDDSVFADMEERVGHVVVSGQIKRLGKSFEKFVQLPENAASGFSHRASVVVHDGFVVVTVPKVDRV